MKKNMGGTDKAIRLLFAMVVLILALTKVITGTLAIVLILMAGVFVLTTMISFCPLYTLLGINTCKKKE